VERALEERVAGKVIAGKYRVRRVVGAGSMGVVCEAEHLEIGKRLAIKLIDASLAGMNDIALRFRQEARAASLVESHHIVQVFDVGADEKLGLYLVMEYLVGEDLAKVLARERRLPPDQAVRIAVQAARGLGKAHEVGVVHRDLKPANIFLAEREDDEPLVKILDFGISKVIDASRADSRLKLTRAGTVVGTPQYMSPEQAQGYSVDKRTDVWAMGLVLYEMLAGRPAYPERGTYEQFIIHLVSHPPDPLRQVAPWVPESLARVVHRAIEHDLSARIPTCFDFAQRLLDAHPVPGVRGTLAGAESADTWADPADRSPYYDEDADRTIAQRESPAPTRTAIMRERPPEDSLTIDVEIEAPIAEAKVSGARRSVEQPFLARSGVHEAPGEDAQDFEEDAPQFFDRRALDRGALDAVSSPAALPSGPTAAIPRPPPPPVQAPTRLQSRIPSFKLARVQSMIAALKLARVQSMIASFKRKLGRSGLAWGAIAFIAVGLLVAVALALR
jgi:serine/threonine-protein kinase